MTLVNEKSTYHCTFCSSDGIPYSRIVSWRILQDILDDIRRQQVSSLWDKSHIDPFGGHYMYHSSNNILHNCRDRCNSCWKWIIGENTENTRMSFIINAQRQQMTFEQLSSS